MTAEIPPPRRALATFLRGARNDDHPSDTTPAPTPAADAPREMDAPAGAPATAEEPAILADAAAAPAQAQETPPATADAMAAEEAPLVDSDNALFEQTADEDGMPLRDSPLAVAVAEPAATAAPSFLRRSRPATPVVRTSGWQWATAAVLGLVLLLQVAIADRANLAADAGTRPLVDGLCTLLRCSLPPWHEPAAFTMLARDIRPVPGHPGALQVQASFRNDARWAQAWPALRLSLSDADGRLIGRRLFAPGDYLGDAHEPAQQLQPGQSAQIGFRIREPAAATVAFSFEFQ